MLYVGGVGGCLEGVSKQLPDVTIIGNGTVSRHKEHINMVKNEISTFTEMAIFILRQL